MNIVDVDMSIYSAKCACLEYANNKASIFKKRINFAVASPLADPVGGGGLRGLQPPLNLKKNSGSPHGRYDRFRGCANVIGLYHDVWIAAIA